MKKLPGKIYIQQEVDDDDTYLLAHDELEPLNDGDVGVYVLEDIKTKTTKHGLE